jgi:hypothetical protein
LSIQARFMKPGAQKPTDDFEAIKMMLEGTTRRPARLQAAERGYRDARVARAEARKVFEAASRAYVSNQSTGKTDPVVSQAYRESERAYALAEEAARKAHVERDEARAAAQPAFAKALEPAATAGHAVMRERLDAAIRAAEALTDAGHAASRSGWTPPKILGRDAPAVLALLRQARVALG